MDDGVTEHEEADDASAMEDEDFVERVHQDIRESVDHSRAWRADVVVWYDFVSGNQWSAEDTQILQDQKRPVITMNRVGPVIETVSGLEVGNRQEVSYLPREQGDVQKNEVLSSAAQWVRDQCDAEDEESESFVDMTISGMGWTDTYLAYEEDPDGKLCVERVDPLEMYWDPRARRKNLDDAKWVARVRWMDGDDFRARWPDKVAECKQQAPDADDGLFDPGMDGLNEAPRPDTAYNNNRHASFDSKRNRYRVIQYLYWEREPFYRVRDPGTGQIGEFGEDQFTTLSDRMSQMGMEMVEDRDFVRQRRRVYRQAYICGATVLENGDAPVKGFNLRCMTAKRDRNSNTWYGLVKPMKDPQEWANKFFSQILHIINSNAKGGVMAEETAFTNPRTAMEEWARPNALTLVKDGAISRGKIQPKPPITYPAGLDRMMEFAVTSIRDVTGVNLELLGMADRQQAGVLEAQRKQAGMTILSTLFDALRRYRKEQGRILLQYIQNYLSDGRLIRIVGEAGRQYVPLIREEGTAQYDVIVDDAPSAPNQKTMVWAMLLQMLPMMKDAIPPQVVADLLEYSPLPSSLVEKLKGMAQQAGQPTPEQQAMQQIGMRQEAAKAAKDEAAARKTDAETQMMGVNADMERQQMAQDMMQSKDEGLLRLMELFAQVQQAQMQPQ